MITDEELAELGANPPTMTETVALMRFTVSASHDGDMYLQCPECDDEVNAYKLVNDWPNIAILIMGAQKHMRETHPDVIA